MDKEQINKKFYEMFDLIELNFKNADFYKSYDMVEDFLLDVESFDDELFKEVFSGEFIQGKDGDKHTKLPAFVMLDILESFVDRKMPNGSKNVYQKRKAIITNKIKALRDRVIVLPHDERFNPEYTFTKACKKDITGTRGNFYFDFQSIKDLDIDGSEVLKDDSVEDKNVFVYYADIPTKTYENVNGKMKNTESGVWHVSDLVFKEEKTLLEEEYFESMQEFANDVIDEITYFFDGDFPKNVDEAKFLLEKRGYSYQKYSDLYKAIEFRYAYLKEKTIKNRENVELYSKNLSVYKKPSKIKPAKKGHEEEVRKGLFSRLRKDIPFNRTNKSKEERVKVFDVEREKQIEKDQEIIDVVIYQKRYINGQKTMVQLDKSEYKVVRR